MRVSAARCKVSKLAQLAAPPPASLEVEAEAPPSLEAQAQAQAQAEAQAVLKAKTEAEADAEEQEQAQAGLAFEPLTLGVLKHSWRGSYGRLLRLSPAGKA